MPSFDKTPYDPMAAFYSAMRNGRTDASQLGSGYGNLDMGLPAEPTYSLPSAGMAPRATTGSSYGQLGSGYFGVPLPTDATAGAVAASPEFWSMDGFLGKKMGDGTQMPGWGSTALGIGQGLMSGFMGMKQYGLMKDQLDESKRQYEQNYAAQRTTTNSRLEDRQRARLASNAGAYESLDSYMNRNGVK